MVSRIRYLPNCYRVVVRHGFMDEVVTKDLAGLIFQHLRDYVIKDDGAQDVLDEESKLKEHDTDAEEKGAASAEAIQTLGLAELQHAYDHRVLYIIGKEEMKVQPQSAFWRVFLLKMFLFIRDYSRTKMSNLKVPTDRLVEIGFVKEV